MASKTMHHVVIGSDTYEIVDEQGRANVATNTQDITALKEDISHIGGLSEDIKQALLQIAAKVAYIDDQGQDYYDALYDALYPPADLVSISAVYTQSGAVYDSDTLDSLKSDLVVTAHYSDSTTQTVTTYTLSGTLAEGTSTVTVAYGGKTTTFNVTVSSINPIYPLTAGSHTFTSNSYPGTAQLTISNKINTVSIAKTNSAYSPRNHVCISNFSANSSGIYDYNADNQTPEWFSLAEGDVIKTVLTLNSFTSNSGNNPSNYGLYFTQTGSDSKAWFCTTDKLTDKGMTIGKTYEIVSTRQSALSVGALAAFVSLGQTTFDIDFSFEIYVNDVRWI